MKTKLSISLNVFEPISHLTEIYVQYLSMLANTTYRERLVKRETISKLAKTKLTGNWKPLIKFANTKESFMLQLLCRLYVLVSGSAKVSPSY